MVDLTAKQRALLLEIIEERIGLIRKARDRAIAEADCEDCAEAKRQTTVGWIDDLLDVATALREAA